MGSTYFVVQYVYTNKIFFSFTRKVNIIINELFYSIKIIVELWYWKSYSNIKFRNI